MALALVDSVDDGPPRCTYCGEVIGVYEPMIRVVGGAAVTTSRAAEAETFENGRGPAYHLACCGAAGSCATQ